MNRLISVAAIVAFWGTGLTQAHAQGPRPHELGAADLDIGEAGIAWLTTWETARAEAKRSNRPIMFVAAATQCRGISGVF